MALPSEWRAPRLGRSRSNSVHRDASGASLERLLATRSIAARDPCPHPVARALHTALTERVLTTSPFVSFPLPHLYTRRGAQSPLRHHLPDCLVNAPPLVSPAGGGSAVPDCLDPAVHQHIKVCLRAS